MNEVELEKKIIELVKKIPNHLEFKVFNHSDGFMTLVVQDKETKLIFFQDKIGRPTSVEFLEFQLNFVKNFLKLKIAKKPLRYFVIFFCINDKDKGAYFFNKGIISQKYPSEIELFKEYKYKDVNIINIIELNQVDYSEFTR